MVECFGIPGVGKTHVALRICHMLEAEAKSTINPGMHVSRASSFNRVTKKTILILRGSIKSPSALKIVFRLIKLHRPERLHIWLKLIANWLYVRALIMDGSLPGAVHVLDQGIGQAVWSTRFYGRESPKPQVVVGSLMKFLDTLPIASILIVNVAAPGSVVLERLTNRRDGRSPLDKDKGLWERANEVTIATKCVLEHLACASERVSLSDYVNHQSSREPAHKTLRSALGTLIETRASSIA